MTFESLQNNLRFSGYEIVIPKGKYSSCIFYAYKRNETAVYSLAVINYTGNDKITHEEYEHMLRTFRGMVIGSGEISFNLLQVVCTYESGLAADIVSGFYPFWVVDVQNERLMVYENQPAHYLDVDRIINDTLDGESYIIKAYEGNGFDNEPGNNSVYGRKKGIPVVTVTLILINALVFIAMELICQINNSADIYEYGVLNYKGVVADGEVYRLLTHFFMHGGIEHICNNMLVLAVIGYYFENTYGKIWFGITYMLSGLIAGITSMTWYHMLGEEVSSLGASGAVFGVCGAMIVMILLDKNKFREVGVFRIGLFLLLTLYSGARDEGVDNVAHVAGFAVGVIITMIVLVIRKGKDINEN